jgi:hypothetical protein
VDRATDESLDATRGALSQEIDALKRGQRREHRVWLGAGFALLLLWAVPARSVPPFPVTVHEFTPNTPARADQINANFSVLRDAVNTNDSRLTALETRDDYVPSGAIAFFASAACPSGWTEHEEANGRYVVAVTGGSTAGATVGATALNDGEDRAHTHGIQHRHRWAHYSGSPSYRWTSWRDGTPGSSSSLIYDWGSGVGGSGHRPLASDSAGYLFTGDALQESSGPASAGAIAPYIQLRACRKN